MTIQDFKEKHIGRRAFIIGKGPSLDTVEKIKDDLETGVVFCLNESIHKIETLGLAAPTYVVQQDSELERDCIPKNLNTVHFMNAWQHGLIPHKDAWIHGPLKHKTLIEKSPWNSNAVVYDPRFLNESCGSLSAIIALKLAAFMGIKSATLCCFDALLNGYQGPTTYANCIGKQKEGSHRSHNAVIMIIGRQVMTEIKTLHPAVAIVEK